MTTAAARNVKAVVLLAVALREGYGSFSAGFCGQACHPSSRQLARDRADCRTLSLAGAHQVRVAPI